MSRKMKVYSDGRVAGAFHSARNVWFYASRGCFEFLHQPSKDGVVQQTEEFKISTSLIRKALKLVDSVKRRDRRRSG